MGSEAGAFPPVQVTLRDGRGITIREVRADDAGAMRAALDHISADARYNRFMGAVAITPAVVERAVHPATQERALAAVESDDPHVTIVGGARYVVERADGEACEFAIMIVDGWRGAGLASSLMSALIRDASSRELKRMEGYVLASNTPMLDLARRLGFEVGPSDEGPSVKRVRLDLARADGGHRSPDGRAAN